MRGSCSRTPLSLSAGRAQFIANLGLGLIYCQIRNISFLFTITHLARYAHIHGKRNTQIICASVSRVCLWISTSTELRVTHFCLPGICFLARTYCFLGCALKLCRVWSRLYAGHPVMNSTRKIEPLFQAKSKPRDFVFWKYYLWKCEWNILRMSLSSWQASRLFKIPDICVSLWDQSLVSKPKAQILLLCVENSHKIFNFLFTQSLSHSISKLTALWANLFYLYCFLSTPYR